MRLPARRLPRLASSRVAAVAVLAVALSATGCGTAAERESRATATVSQWLAALEGAEEDRGWQYLDEMTQDNRLGGDRAAYVEAAEETDWSGFEWRITGVHEHDGHWRVDVQVDGGLAAVPPIFIEKNLGFPLCENQEGTGLGCWVEMPWIGQARVGTGALTGTADRGECV